MRAKIATARAPNPSTKVKNSAIATPPGQCNSVMLCTPWCGRRPNKDGLGPANANDQRFGGQSASKTHEPPKTFDRGRNFQATKNCPPNPLDRFVQVSRCAADGGSIVHFDQ
jgi:hypothetical protein